jgi:hypothetical protein
MTAKEQLIRSVIIPQLESFSCHLWDTDSRDGRMLDKIIFDLQAILDDEDD